MKKQSDLKLDPYFGKPLRRWFSPKVQPQYDYEADRLAKLKRDRERKNKRNRRGRTQTQGAGLGAVSNILGG